MADDDGEWVPVTRRAEYLIVLAAVAAMFLMAGLARLF